MPNKRFDENTKARSVRLVRGHADDSEWAAMCAVSARLGMTAETLRKWVRQAKVDAGEAGLEELHMRIAPRFACSEPRERVLAYVRGLLAPLEKKNSWRLAERAGEVIPDGMQRLCATMCVATWSIWETRPGCWWSTYTVPGTMPRCARPGPNSLGVVG